MLFSEHILNVILYSGWAMKFRILLFVFTSLDLMLHPFFQQWMVNGEICIGLFALRNIKQVCFLPPIITFMCISLLITLYLVASYFGIFCCYVLNNFESLYQLCQFIFLYVCLLCILIIDCAGKCEIVYFQTRSLKTIEFSTSLLPLK
jgi:hypothetical protein